MGKGDITDSRRFRGIDHYQSNRNNAYLLEFTVGKSKVLACSMGVLERLKPNTGAHTSWANAAAFLPNEAVEASYLLKCFLDYTHSSCLRRGQACRVNPHQSNDRNYYGPYTFEEAMAEWAAWAKTGDTLALCDLNRNVIPESDWPNPPAN